MGRRFFASSISDRVPGVQRAHGRHERERAEVGTLRAGIGDGADDVHCERKA
jgi:hypothetical protein